MKSLFLQELKNRNLIHQATNLEEIDNLLLNNNIKAYIGFDCTAKSLHVGSLVQIMILRLLAKFGQQPIILLGGGTTLIGDPSGKDKTRSMMSSDDIAKNTQLISKLLKKFIPNAQIVNNSEWLLNLNYIDFLRKIGRHFSINKMLNFDSVKIRLEEKKSLTFLEFNYMILQAYDFVELYKKYNCRLQIGGSDQWGNIVNGIDLARRLAAVNEIKNEELFGLTTPLITTADGKKMGKSEKGAVWLDEALFSPYDYFQYFRNVDDSDVIKFLLMFSDVDIKEIKKLAKLTGQEINKAKEILAFEATKICHGENAAKECLQKAANIFIKNDTDSLDEFNIDAAKPLFIILRESGLCKSGGEAKNMIAAGAIKINEQKITDDQYSVKENCILSCGKKKKIKISIKSPNEI